MLGWSDLKLDETLATKVHVPSIVNRAIKACKVGEEFMCDQPGPGEQELVILKRGISKLYGTLWTLFINEWCRVYRLDEKAAA